jgi:ABC-2 type transport system permease protein
MSTLRVVGAFLRRDWQIERSYRAAFVFRLTTALASLATFFFIDRLIPLGTAQALSAYGGRYFPFVLVGLAFARYMGAGLSSIGGALRSEQVEGTLEHLLMMPIRPVQLVLGCLAWDLVVATLEVLTYLALGGLCFGAWLTQANSFAAVVMVLLTIVSLSGLGIIAACGVLYFREADPVNWALQGLMKLLSGVIFPVAVMPPGLQALAQLLPLTHALEGLRQTLLLGAGLPQVVPQCLILLGVACLCWPLGLWLLGRTLNYLRARGSLNHR